MKLPPLLLSLVVMSPAFAQDRDIPADAMAISAIRSHPTVLAAEAGIRAGQAHAVQIENPHETQFKVGSQQRRETQTDTRYREWDVGLERAIRLPGKSARDRELGEQSVVYAKVALNDARHETARLLLSGWFDWCREAVGVQAWAEQVDLLRQQREVAARRVQLGDIPKLELQLAESALAQAEAQLSQATMRKESAALAFHGDFAAIPLPAQPALQTPTPLTESREAWQEKLLAHNHELLLARTAAMRAQLVARRADADKVPDPSIGVRYGSERGGTERITGFSLTIPLPGQGRRAAADGALAESDIAAQREAQVLARVRSESNRSIALAASSYAAWRQLADANQRIENNVRLLDKAWRLGEGSFQDVLTARRQSIEARLAAVQAQVDARYAWLRLQVDAHLMWDADDEPESP